MGEGHLPAYAGAFDGNGNFAMFEAFSSLYALETGLGLADPEVVGRVGVDTDVGLGDGGGARHGDWLCGGLSVDEDENEDEEREGGALSVKVFWCRSRSGG